MDALPYARESEGLIAEFGVWKGDTTKRLARLGRTVYAFDTFCGMPDNGGFDAELDYSNPIGKFDPEAQDFKVLFHLSNTKLIKGEFEESLPRMPKCLKFGFAYVDCDWYSSHMTVLRWLASGHLDLGAKVVFDDYRTVDGARVAIDEWCAEHELKLIDECLVVWNG